MMRPEIRDTYTGDDETLVINRQQDVQFLLDDNQRLAAETAHNRSDMRLAGRVPLVIMEQWMRECGAALGSKELNAYVKRKLMDGEFAKLRVRGY